MADNMSLATKGAGAETKKIAGAITSMGIDELIYNMAKGIAEGQARLDQTCMDLAVEMGEAQIEFGKIPGTNDADVISLIELGFTPNFYQFVDTILEVRVSVSSQYEEEQEISTSEFDKQDDEHARQTEYNSQRNSSASNWNYSANRSLGVNFGRRSLGINSGYSASGGRSGSSSASSFGTKSLDKNKSVKINTVDATFSSKYAYSVEGSSLIKTKIVPVPPPQVFEEAVQSKAKERKEWAKRYALLRFSKGLLPAIGDSASEVASSIESADTTAPDISEIEEIKGSIESMSEEYDKLTNDHWAVIEGVEDRRSLDQTFANLKKQADKLMSYFAPDSSGKIKFKSSATKGDYSDDLEACKDKMIGNKDKRITGMKARIDSIMERLPQTPEEMAAEGPAD